jgi:riboflavin synthase alpha subunit
VTPSSISPFDRVNALLILGSIACIGLYVIAIAYAGRALEAQLEQERAKRAHFERVAEQREVDLDGALAKIHELGGEGADRQRPQPADE